MSDAVSLVPRRRRWQKATVLVVCWAGANLIALWLCDLYEACQLGREHKVAASVIREFERRVVTVADDTTAGSVSLAYRVRMPSIWAGQHSTPLLILLHGSGQRGYDGVQQLRGAPAELCTQHWAADFPCALLVPQCPEKLSWSSSITGQLRMSDLLLQMIDDVLQDRRIDSRRVYLSGYSMGGFGAWHLAAQAPDRFAAVVPIAGGASPDLAEQLKDVRLWAVHSADDETVSVDTTRQIIGAIRDAGGDPFYTELTDAGHRSWPEVYSADSAILKWMFVQRLSER